MKILSLLIASLLTISAVSAQTTRVLLINGEAFTYGKDYTFLDSLNADGTISRDRELGLEVAWGGYGISDSAHNNLAGVDAKGGALLLLGGDPGLNARAAAKLGATVLFIIDTNYVGQKKLSSSIGVYIISKEVAKSIVGDKYDGLVSSVGHLVDFHTSIALYASQEMTPDLIRRSAIRDYVAIAEYGAHADVW